MKLELAGWLRTRPYGEVGPPVAVWRSETSGVTVVVGRLNLERAGRRIADHGARELRIGVYDGDGRLLHVIDRPFRHAVIDAAFHPTAPVVVLATGAWDGGSQYEGRVLWHNHETGETRTILEEMAAALRFEGPCELTLDLALDSIFCEVPRGTWLTRRRFSRPDWRDVPTGAIPYRDERDERLPPSPEDLELRLEEREHHAAMWEARTAPPRTATRGRTTVDLAWPEHGALLVEHEDGSLDLVSGGTPGWSATSRAPMPRRWGPSVTGEGFVLQRAGQIVWIEREYRDVGAPDLVYAPDDTVAHIVQLGSAPGDDFGCTVRGGRYLYACTAGSVRAAGRPWHLAKRVVRVEPHTGEINELFPVEWLPEPRPSGSRGGHPYNWLSSFVGLELREGAELLYAAAEEEINERLVASWILRRDTTTGAVAWATAIADSYVTGLCELGEGHVAASLLDGRLVVLDIDDGQLVTELQLDALARPTAVGIAARGEHLAVATAEGAIALVRWSATRER